LGVLTVATVNVNGIRAAFRRGMAPWLKQTDPDLLLMQEVRATDDVLREYLGDWHIAHAEPSLDGHKGRAGVAVASRRPIKAERPEVGPERFAGCGRWIEADVVLDDGSTLTAVSTYVFTGEFETPPRQEEKYAFLDAITARLTELRADGRHVLMCGDLNIAHREVDLKAWKANRKKSGFLPEERAWMDRLFESGWVDLGRRFGGEGPGPYSWWSWRGKAFDNDAGWRIDYQIASPALASAATSCSVHRAPTYAERWSDHAPVVATYSL
jgi:exodeoxyribonuclease-3